MRTLCDEWAGGASVRLVPHRYSAGQCNRAAALVALTAVLASGDGDSDQASMWISAISAFVSACAFVADLLRIPAGDGTRRERRRRADELAEAVRAQWAAEARLRRLQDPEPLSVRWSRPGPPLADHRRNVRRGLVLPEPREGDQCLERIVETFRSVPSRRLVVLGGPGAGRPPSPSSSCWARSPRGGRATACRCCSPSRAGTRAPPGCASGWPNGWPRSTGRWATAAGGACRRLSAELDDRLPVLLTCRTTDCARAVHGGDVVTAAEVVELRPLDFTTVRAFLECTTPSRDDGSTVWTPVLAAPAAPLSEVLGSPLMVALARTVYGDRRRDPADLLDAGRFPTDDHIAEHLLDAFAPAAFGDPQGTWHPDAARRRLRAMPRAMRVIGSAPAEAAHGVPAGVLLPSRSGVGRGPRELGRTAVTPDGRRGDRIAEPQARADRVDAVRRRGPGRPPVPHGAALERRPEQAGNLPCAGRCAHPRRRGSAGGGPRASAPGRDRRSGRRDAVSGGVAGLREPSAPRPLPLSGHRRPRLHGFRRRHRGLRGPRDPVGGRARE